MSGGENLHEPRMRQNVSLGRSKRNEPLEGDLNKAGKFGKEKKFAPKDPTCPHSVLFRYSRVLGDVKVRLVLIRRGTGLES